MDKEKDLYRIPKGFKESTFGGIKEELIRQAKSISDIKDYDYDGSTASSFLNIQANALLKHELFTNIAILESNIHTAQDRRSVVQHAQNNGYIPSGMMASRISLMLQCRHRDEEPSIKIPRGTKFQGKQREDGRAYNFVVYKDTNAIRGEGGYYFPVLDLVQGRIMRIETTFEDGNPILIREKNIDRNHIRVWVNDEEWTDWTYNNIVDITGGSTVFYTRETFDEETEIRFGVGEVSYSKAGKYVESNFIGGLKPIEGSKIVIEYIRTEGYHANGCKIFTYNDSVRGVIVEEVLVNYNSDPDFIGSFGGGDIEDIESVRENGIMAIETQRRAVTDSDWKTILDRKYSPIIQARQVFNPTGAQNVVVVAIKPKGALNLTSDQKREIRDYLNQYHMGRIQVEIQKPIYIFIDHDIRVNYSINELNESKDWLETQIINSITKFYKEEVEFFNTPLHKSKLLAAVDRTHPSIKGSSAIIKLVREVDSFYQTSYIGIGFYNKPKEGSLRSNEFTFIRNPFRDPSEIEKRYNIFIQSNSSGDIIAGPFVVGDVDYDYEPYYGDDIDNNTIMTIDGEAQDRFYKIGSIDRVNDRYEWSFGSIGLETDHFVDPYIELSIEVDENEEDSIDVGEGALIIYEHDLRPQYTRFRWNAIT